jgi:dihydroorotate dehydrogenase electron transfer subunit
MNNRFHVPKCLPIHKRIIDAEDVATLLFKLPPQLEMDIFPGQYFMLWVPGDDEIPIAVSEYQEEIISFTIFDLGPTSHNLIESPVGALVGLRGPYGNGFKIENTEISIIIGGGIGLAPLRYLIHQILEMEVSQRIIMIEGARTKNGIIFREEFNSLPIESIFFTDDGSLGRQGFPTVALQEFLETDIINSPEKFTIYACGPEAMLVSAVSVTKAKKVTNRMQISIADRFIRCGFGVCGSCFIDEKGFSICHDGPVFRADLIADLVDFGVWGRGPDGDKFPLI